MSVSIPSLTREAEARGKHLGLRPSYLILDIYLAGTLASLFSLAKFYLFLFIRTQTAIFQRIAADEGTYSIPGTLLGAELRSKHCETLLRPLLIVQTHISSHSGVCKVLGIGRFGCLIGSY